MPEKVTNLDHLTLPAGTEARLPEDSPAAKAAEEYRKVQLSSNPSDEDLKKVGAPLSHPVDESQVVVPSSSKFVYAESTEDLPEGVAGRIVSDGIFEIYENTDTSKKALVDDINAAREEERKREEEARAQATKEREEKNREELAKREQPEVMKLSELPHNK